MATGSGNSGGNDDDNPFSFHYFIKKSSKKKDDLEVEDSPASDDDKSEDFPEPSDGADSTVKVDEPAADNPFSFRKFLCKDSPAPSSSPRSSRPVKSGYDPMPDVASGLPDFVQDHVQRDMNRRGSNSGQVYSASELSLPDFVMGTVNAPSTADSSYSGVFPSINAIGSLIGGREDGPTYNKNLRPSSGNRKDGARHGAMPSFLESVGIDEDNENYHDDQGDILAENHRLKEENTSLKRQLLEMRDMARNESERVAQLVQQVKTLQNKEAYETAALEKMVQQVEANLEATTERAVRAESVITKQKQEIRHLREQLSSSHMTNGDMDDPMDEVRDRTQYMSQQLAATAANAEATLKQMLGGVQNLKLMSEILSSIGKIYDEPEEPAPQPQTSQPKKDSDADKTDNNKTSSSSKNSNEPASSKNLKTDKNSKTESKPTESTDKPKPKTDSTSARKKPVTKSQTAEKSKK